MSEHEFDSTHEVIDETPTSHKVAFGLLTAGLVIALAGGGYLWSKSNALMNEISSTQSSTTPASRSGARAPKHKNRERN